MATRIPNPHLLCLRQNSSVLPRQSQPRRCLSSTPVPQLSRDRRKMFRWLRGPGAVFKRPRQDSTNYLGAYDATGKLLRAGETVAQRREKARRDREDGDSPAGAVSNEGKKELPPETLEDMRPFPLNPYFRSEPVVSEALRDEIFRRVVGENQTVREVSIALHVTMERIGAVVRMKTIEQEWIRQDKSLNLKYQSTVMGMLPQTKFSKNSDLNPRHESINDLPVHRDTLSQFFHLTSESRHFTREDAGRVFHRDLLPADKRIPHPEMIEAARDAKQGYRQGEVARRLAERITDMETKRKDDERKQREREAKKVTVVEGRRWDFRFKDVSVDTVGKDGRGPNGVGWRYGAPHEDRKKGQVKIPTKVDF